MSPKFTSLWKVNGRSLSTATWSLRMALHTTKKMKKCKDQRICRSLVIWLHNAEWTMATLETTTRSHQKEVSFTMSHYLRLKLMLWQNSSCSRQFSKSSRGSTQKCSLRLSVAISKSSGNLVAKNEQSLSQDTIKNSNTVRSSLKITAITLCAI